MSKVLSFLFLRGPLGVLAGLLTLFGLGLALVTLFMWVCIAILVGIVVHALTRALLGFF